MSVDREETQALNAKRGKNRAYLESRVQSRLEDAFAPSAWL